MAAALEVPSVVAEDLDSGRQICTYGRRVTVAQLQAKVQVWFPPPLETLQSVLQAVDKVPTCVTTETRPLDRLGQLGECHRVRARSDGVCVSSKIRYLDRLDSVRRLQCTSFVTDNVSDQILSSVQAVSVSMISSDKCVGFLLMRSFRRCRPSTRRRSSRMFSSFPPANRPACRSATRRCCPSLMQSRAALATLERGRLPPGGAVQVRRGRAPV